MGDHAQRRRGSEESLAGALFPPEPAPDPAAGRSGAAPFRARVPLHHRRRASEDQRCRPTICRRWRFVGRSNVGKSSLFNALTGRTALARVSQTPGRTRQINFFDLAAADAGGSSGLWLSPRRPRTRSGAGAGLCQRYAQGPRGVEARAPPDRRAPRLHAGRPRLHEAPRQGGGVLPGGADQDPTRFRRRRSRSGSPRWRRNWRSTRPRIPQIHADERRDGFGIAELRAALAALAAPAAAALDFRRHGRAQLTRSLATQGRDARRGACPISGAMPARPSSSNMAATRWATARSAPCSPRTSCS